jgi:tyrosinase
MFQRQDVWALTDSNEWHPTIEYYARAISELSSRNNGGPTDPTSWNYMAAIHGTRSPRRDWPEGATWNECQHDGWYFLPWHRIYLHYFETNVRAAVVKLRGPADWALPYWNYSDATKPNRRSLPPAFRAERLPDGTPNPLFSDRRNGDIKRGGKLPPDYVDVANALAETGFVGPSGRLSGFGGGVTGRSHGGGPRGTLENVPHAMVHGGVGGLMGAFETAGLDPIFWLHHANIDRLWEVWLRSGAPRSNPTEREWLDTKFTVGQGAAAMTMAARDVIDTAKPPLNYSYSDVAIPQRPEIAVTKKRRGARKEAERMDRERVPEMIGGSETGIPLTNSPTHAEISLSPPSGPARGLAGPESAESPIVYLKIENVSGRQPAGDAYAVYLNLPPGANPSDHPERQAGSLSLFGVREATEIDEQHTGSGVTVSFNITAIARQLEEIGDWDPQRLRVTFSPLSQTPGVDAGDVRVGRVSVYMA